MSARPLRFGSAIGAHSAGVPGGAEIADFARRAEAAGFDSVQVGDHIQWHAPILEATIVMATFAAVTSRVRIASDVVILPLRDPVLIAKTVASLDVLSGGRVIFGVGVGGEHPAEYAAMRVPVAERGSRANESLEIVRGLLTHERFSYTGRHYTIENVAIFRAPCSRRCPSGSEGRRTPPCGAPRAMATAGSRPSRASGSSRDSWTSSAAIWTSRGARRRHSPGARSSSPASGPTLAGRGRRARRTSATSTGSTGRQSWTGSEWPDRWRPAPSACGPTSRRGRVHRPVPRVRVRRVAAAARGPRRGDREARRGAGITVVRSRSLARSRPR